MHTWYSFINYISEVPNGHEEKAGNFKISKKEI